VGRHRALRGRPVRQADGHHRLRQRPEHALQTREKLFAQLAKDRTLVAAAHISFPGLGHVRKEGAAYAWVPVIYQPVASAK